MRDSAAQVIGSALLHVAAAKDGTTLFWACNSAGQPLACRWGNGDQPWRLTLPLEDCKTPNTELVLGASVDPWTYKQPMLTSTYRCGFSSLDVDMWNALPCLGGGSRGCIVSQIV